MKSVTFDNPAKTMAVPLTCTPPLSLLTVALAFVFFVFFLYNDKYFSDSKYAEKLEIYILHQDLVMICYVLHDC